MSESEHIRIVQPPHFAAAKGYSNGMVASGQTLYIAGQVGWERDQRFVAKDFTGQFKRALQNVVDVVEAAGGQAQHLVQMTIYATDVSAYRGALKEVGVAWQSTVGMHFPAVALVGVSELVEPEAVVEIVAIAVLPE